MRFYIAGPITHDPDYKGKFAAVERVLKRNGFETANPANSGAPEEAPYRDYIDRGLHMLMRCDAICMLPGYERSHGAMLELKYAETVDIPRIYAEQDLTGAWHVFGLSEFK